MKKGKLVQEFAKFQKNESIQAKEMKKVSGGTCVFYCSRSYGDCDRDDYTLTGTGPWQDIDRIEKPGPSAD